MKFSMEEVSRVTGDSISFLERAVERGLLETVEGEVTHSDLEDYIQRRKRDAHHEELTPTYRAPRWARPTERQLTEEALATGLQLLEDDPGLGQNFLELARLIRQRARVPLSYALTAVQVLDESGKLQQG